MSERDEGRMTISDIGYYRPAGSGWYSVHAYNIRATPPVSLCQRYTLAEKDREWEFTTSMCFPCQGAILDVLRQPSRCDAEYCTAEASYGDDDGCGYCSYHMHATYGDCGPECRESHYERD